MNRWNEIRTAYQLAKLGTVSATAKELGVHRATVMRHIDALEAAMETVLFQRNDKGYIPTQAGIELMQVAEVSDHHFSRLALKFKSIDEELSGVLRITAVEEMAQYLMPVVAHYQMKHPKMRVEFIGDLRNFALEYGEADIAIRAGARPTTPDNIVFELFSRELVFCAHSSYIERLGMPNSVNAMTEHHFVCLKDRAAHLAWNEWIYQHIESEKISVMATSMRSVFEAILAGCGIGILPKDTVETESELVELSLGETWQVSVWGLVHRDMYKLSKVKEFVALLKAMKQSQH